MLLSYWCFQAHPTVQAYFKTAKSQVNHVGPNLPTTPPSTASTLVPISYAPGFGPPLHPPASIELVSQAASDTTPSSPTRPSYARGGFGSPKGAAASTGAPCQHSMFLARVLVGRYAQGAPGVRRPPPLNPRDKFGKTYDSCVNNVDHPSVYVVFDSPQCYPEYIIHYTVQGCVH